MQTEIVVAVVTGGLGLLAAVGASAFALVVNTRSSRTQADLESLRIRHEKDAEARRLQHEHDVRTEDRLLEANDLLDRYRLPLLAAADDLANRVNNIRFESFLDAYLHGEGRRAHLAVRSTEYRFAKYYAVVESLQRNVTYLRFQEEKDTREVAVLLRNVSSTMASDQWDWDSARGPRLMVWREEQRAIGGQMRCPGHSSDTLGFETFTEQYAEHFAYWFSDFASDLQQRGAKDSRRLAQLQDDLGALVRYLDNEHLYEARTAWWMQNVRRQDD